MSCIRFTRLLLLALLITVLPAVALAGVFVSVTVAPPPLPVYVQPPCPEPGYIWTPGYWAWGEEGYYWVPGTWVPAPEAGLLWTPGYWGWDNGFYVWNAGYWGPTVGFYGGIDYGYGYPGLGFIGGEWRGDHFFYNTAIEHIDRHRIHDFYQNRSVVEHYRNASRVSYNGGVDGIRSAPTEAQLAARRGNHIQPTALQTRQEESARRNPALLARNNHGRPAIAATAKPGDFSRANVTPARAAGGRINAATLRATPKSMPTARKNFAAPRQNTRAVTRAGQGAPQTSSARKTPSSAFTHGQTQRAAGNTAGRGIPSRTPSANNRASSPAFRGNQPKMSSRAARPGGGFQQPNFNNRPHAMASPSSPVPRAERPQAFSPSQNPAPRFQAPRAQSRPAPAAPPRNFARSSPAQPHFSAPAPRSAPAARPQPAPRENGNRR